MDRRGYSDRFIIDASYNACFNQEGLNLYDKYQVHGSRYMFWKMFQYKY